MTTNVGVPDLGRAKRLLGGFAGVGLMAGGVLWLQGAIDLDGIVCGMLFALLGLALAGAAIHGAEAT